MVVVAPLGPKGGTGGCAGMVTVASPSGAPQDVQNLLPL